MNVETTKMSSRGQVVIPQSIRDSMHAKEGTIFAIIADKDKIVLKKIETPSKAMLLKELTSLAKEGKRRLENKGINESDIPDIVQKSRRH